MFIRSRPIILIMIELSVIKVADIFGCHSIRRLAQSLTSAFNSPQDFLRWMIVPSLHFGAGDGDRESGSRSTRLSRLRCRVRSRAYDQALCLFPYDEVHLTKRCSRRLPAVRSRFLWLKQFRRFPAALPVAAGELVLVRSNPCAFAFSSPF